MELHKVTVSSSNKKLSGTFAGMLLCELNKIEKQSSRIYRTRAYRNDIEQTDYVFSTTSKDVHLFFGVLSSEGQMNLAYMLDEEFRLGKCSQLLLCLQQNKGDALVTQTLESGSATDLKTIVFTFSPAH